MLQAITTYKAKDRDDWRAWLEKNYDSATEIWLLYDDRPDCPTVSYLDSVEEAICFGWIDGLQKRVNDTEKAQRFTPRRKRSHWTELNKERARRLIRLGKMTDAGQATLPDLDEPFTVPADILDALKATPKAWENFQRFPDLYIRVRISYIEEMRKRPAEFEKRLNNFLKKTVEGKLFGKWNDDGRLG